MRESLGTRLTINWKDPTRVTSDWRQNSCSKLLFTSLYGKGKFDIRSIVTMGFFPYNSSIIHQLRHVSSNEVTPNWILPMVQQGRGQKETTGPHCSLSACQSLLPHDLPTCLWLVVICVHWLRPLKVGVEAFHSDTPCSCTACRAWIPV